MDRIISVFGSSKTEPLEPEWIQAERLGRFLAEAGFGVATGGYDGTMKAVSKGAHEAGAPVIGISAPNVFPKRRGVNEFVAKEIAAEHLLERIHQLTSKSLAAIALPGSIGTLTELIIAWNLAFLAPLNNGVAKPLVTVGGVWRKIILVIEQEISAPKGLVQCVDTVDEAVAAVTKSLSAQK